MMAEFLLAYLKVWIKHLTALSSRPSNVFIQWKKELLYILSAPTSYEEIPLLL
jgi:hypothetical protein